ncbi:hypothetical protein HPB50_015819 [Hyalomma asiaticum]|uniref:Uncharacterized protein n=1 Tax=Hyalomma asiaticum TaxID=266040 RepID=A0ACB7RTF9_HYAAI|nr:hypothetical protein HPB50_015819 [Hyalomma asiaticum]
MRNNHGVCLPGRLQEVDVVAGNMRLLRLRRSLHGKIIQADRNPVPAIAARYKDRTAPVTFYVTTEDSSPLDLDARKVLCMNVHGATLSGSQVSSTVPSRVPSNAPSEFPLFTQDVGLIKPKCTNLNVERACDQSPPSFTD